MKYLIIFFEKGNAFTDNLFFVCRSRLRRETKPSTIFRRISARTLAVDFKIPWQMLAETNAEAENAETKTALNRKWWCLLEKVRTHFQQNPDL
ncbi:MAG: hypothetical protein WC831_06225 [Parcubacteria group bacterium]|jgi:hypothetical protein